MRIQIYGWPLAPFDKPATTQEELMSALRQMRDVLLKESDWTQSSDSPLSEEIRNDWRIWRQSVRDITDTVENPLPYVVDLGELPGQGVPSSWSNWDVDVLESTWTTTTAEQKAAKLEDSNGEN
jgi:hypothetical protein